MCTFVGKVMFLLFSMLSRIVRFSSKEQVSFNFMVAVTICSDFGAQEIESLTVSTLSPSLPPEVVGLDAMIFVFCMLSFKPALSLSSFTFIRRLFSSSLPLVWYHLHVWGYWYFSSWKWQSLSRVWLFGTSWTIQCMEFSRPEYYSG